MWKDQTISDIERKAENWAKWEDRDMFQMKEQNQTPEEELSKVEVSSLPGEAQGSDHKGAQWAWEKDGWTAGFQQSDQV